jgi:hypothetical protein
MVKMGKHTKDGRSPSSAPRADRHHRPSQRRYLRDEEHRNPSCVSSLRNDASRQAFSYNRAR